MSDRSGTPSLPPSTFQSAASTTTAGSAPTVRSNSISSGSPSVAPGVARNSLSGPSAAAPLPALPAVGEVHPLSGSSSDAQDGPGSDAAQRSQPPPPPPRGQARGAAGRANLAHPHQGGRYAPALAGVPPPPPAIGFGDSAAQQGASGAYTSPAYAVQNAGGGAQHYGSPPPPERAEGDAYRLPAPAPAMAHPQQQPAQQVAAPPAPMSSSAHPAGHPLSLKVMRISQPSLAAAGERPYFEAGEYDGAEHALWGSAGARRAASADSARLLAAQAGAPAPAPGAEEEEEEQAQRALWSALDPEMTQEEINELLRFHDAHGAHGAPPSDDGDAASHSASASAQTLPRTPAPTSALRQVRDALQAAAREDLLSNEPPALLPALESGGISTMRDWPTSNLLTLPASFGTVYFGETFSAFVCVNNETISPVAGVSLRVEMQYGPGAAAASAQVPAPLDPAAAGRTHTALLAHIHLPPKDAGAEGAPQGIDGDAAASAALEHGRKLQTVIKHPISQVGPHVLVCTVTYLVPMSGGSGGGGAPYGEQRPYREMSLRKFYRFSVAECPLSVRMKTHVPRAPAQRYHARHEVREHVLLEVQLSHRAAAPDTPAAAAPMVVEDVRLLLDGPLAARWTWIRLDRPDVRSENWSEELLALVEPERAVSLSKKKSDRAEPFMVGPGESHHLLFALYPASKTQNIPLPPAVPPTPPAHQMLAAPAPSTPHSRPGMAAARAGSYGFPPVPPSAGGAGAGGHAAAGWREAQASAQPFAVTLPLGKIDVRWRSAMGEAGHLQTAVVSARARQDAPVFCPPDAEALALPASANGTAPPPPPSKLPSPDAPMLLQCQVRVLDAPRDAVVLEPFQLRLQIWVRDVLLAGKAASQSAHFVDEEDDSDDDRPLSEYAKSPSISSRASMGGDSRRGSTYAAAQKPHDALQARWVRLAVQFTRPHYPTAAEAIEAATASALPVAPTPIVSSRSDIPAQKRGYMVRSTGEPAPMSPSTSSTGSSQPSFLSSPRRAASSRGTSLPSDGDSRPGTPTAGKPAPSPSALQAARRDVPLPPPKSPAAHGGDPASAGTARAQRHPFIPRPFIDVPDDAHDVPDDEVHKLGNSLELLPPVRLAASSAAAADGEGGAAHAIAGEATAELPARYLSEVQGLAKIGGLRIYLLGWWDDRAQAERLTVDSAAADAAADPGRRLARPLLIKDLALETIAELFIGGFALDD